MRLVVDGRDVAPCQVAATHWQKLRGLLGRSSYDGAMYFRDVPSVHTMFMAFSIDVAVCDRDGRVIDTQTLLPFRFSRSAVGAHDIVEAQAGSFERWGIRAGSTVMVSR